MNIQSRIDLIRAKVIEKGIKLNPTIPLEEVRSFEEQYKVEFPEEYREFILKVGNGGDGPPYYRISDLMTSIEISKGFAKGNNDFLSEEFPLSNYLVWEGLELSEEDVDKQNRINRGNLIIGEEGCSIYWALIITGSERGQMWYFTDAGVQPCAPGLSFLDWYEYWLDGGSDWWREFKY